MKKIPFFASLFLLASCSVTDHIATWWDDPRAYMEGRYAYDITYIDQEPALINSETISEKKYKAGEILTAYKGQSVVDAKSFRKDYYASETARINENGGLNSGSAPIVFKKGQEKNVIGITNIDGATYYLIPSDFDGFVYLVTDNGSFHKHMGQIRHNRLVILDTIYVPYPSTLRFEPVTKNSTVQTKAVKGFDIKYDGIAKGQLAFIYFDYENATGDVGNFENIYYPNKKGRLKIRDAVINILNATDEKLDYMILE